jgi:hypothetical protein
MMLKIVKRVLNSSLMSVTLMMVCLLASTSSRAAPSLGVYQGNGCDGLTGLAGFASWFGRQPDFVLDFFASDSWTSMMGDANWAVGCWNRQNKTVVFSVPMLPTDGSTLAQGASGQFDDKFRALAQMLASKGHGKAIIRLGWEFNGGWYAWAAKKDPTSWVKYWQRIVTTMRSVPGTAFRFDWCSAQGYQQIPASSVYPGDAYVDIIGRDNYNQTWITDADTPVKRWNVLLTEQYGLNWVREFSTLHDKPVSIPEWGTGTRPDGHGGGDDAYFVTQMATWIRNNNVEYHGYWDFAAPDYNAKLSAGHQPLAAKAYLAAFRAMPRAPTNVVARIGT